MPRYRRRCRNIANKQYCDQPPELVLLCTEHCPYEDCTRRDGCKYYKEIEHAIRNGKPFEYPDAWQPPETPADPQAYLDAAWKKLKNTPEPAIMIEDDTPHADRATLAHMNTAIKALKSTLEGLWEETTISDMIESLQQLRCQKFEHLVDWDAVAKGGK